MRWCRVGSSHCGRRDPIRPSRAGSRKADFPSKRSPLQQGPTGRVLATPSGLLNAPESLLAIDSSGSCLPPIVNAGPSAQHFSMIDCPSAYIVDGDTLRCGSERVRLLGIDAPEIERCPRWRVCAPGDGRASKRSLIAGLRLGPIRYRPIARDRYGRQVAVVWAGRVNLSCWQLDRRQAIYKMKWDNGGIIASACR
jgi:micrococcal nuclease